MVDIDAAIGYVVARGDAVDRARLSHLRTGSRPPPEIFDHVERGQTTTGGWPAQPDDPVASIDATCFRLAELDDLSGLTRPSALRALRWLAGRQGLDGFWEEDRVLASSAPPWAQPGDPDARFYLTANAAFWLTVASADRGRGDQSDGYDEGVPRGGGTPLEGPPYELNLTRAARVILDSIDENCTWPGFLASGWLAGAVLHRTGWFYESARILTVLGDRVPSMSASDVATMAAALRRAGVRAADSLMQSARDRLDETQRPDGSWPSDDATAFDVHTTLTALRALR